MLNSVSLTDSISYINIDKFNNSNEWVPQEASINYYSPIIPRSDENNKYQIAVVRGIFDLTLLPLSVKTHHGPLIITDRSNSKTVDIRTYLPDRIYFVNDYIMAFNMAMCNLEGKMKPSFFISYDFSLDKILIKVLSPLAAKQFSFNEEVIRLYFHGFDFSNNTFDFNSSNFNNDYSSGDPTEFKDGLESGDFPINLSWLEPLRKETHKQGDYPTPGGAPNDKTYNVYQSELPIIGHMNYYDTFIIRANIPISPEYTSANGAPGVPGSTIDILFDSIVNTAEYFGSRGPTTLQVNNIRWINLNNVDDLNNITLSLWARSKNGDLERIPLSPKNHFHVKLAIARQLQLD